MKKLLDPNQEKARVDFIEIGVSELGCKSLGNALLLCEVFRPLAII